MKTLLFALVFVSCISWGFAQSISLDPNSLQLPRVATNPTCAVADKGKLIYNTTQNKILFCNGSAWIDPITGATPNNWANAGNNAILLNGRAGIGTDSPTATVDINGNLRIRGNFPTKGSTLVSIDSDGTLNWQKPYAFRVDGLESESNVNIGAGQTIELTFNYPTYNVGLMYSNLSGRMTTPVKGIYHIDAHINTFNTTTVPGWGDSPDVRLMRTRNGASVILQESSFTYIFNDDSVIFGPEIHHSISGDFLLEPGDQIWIQAYAEKSKTVYGKKHQSSLCARLAMQIF